MTDLIGLPDKWCKSKWIRTNFDCAKELEAALPKPTIFTYAADSWPEDGQEFVFRYTRASGESVLEASTWDESWKDPIEYNDKSNLVGATWWPIGNLFNLPEAGS